MELFHKIIRRISRFAWREMLFDVARVEWKYGRYDDGTPKDWTEWNNVRNHLKETKNLRNSFELTACKNKPINS